MPFFLLTMPPVFGSIRVPSALVINPVVGLTVSVGDAEADAEAESEAVSSDADGLLLGSDADESFEAAEESSWVRGFSLRSFSHTSSAFDAHTTRLISCDHEVTGMVCMYKWVGSRSFMLIASPTKVEALASPELIFSALNAVFASW